MCILFIFAAKNPSPPTLGGNICAAGPSLKLVIASNRDEFYKRPTKIAQCWDSNPNILAGQDIEEGGTWLGITKTGKFAALLNITSKIPEKKMRSRGAFVTGFLDSDPNLRGWTYCNNLHQDPALDIRNNFRLFNFIAIDVLSRSPESNPQQQQDQDEKPKIKAPNVSSSKKNLSETMNITYITNANESGPRSLSQDDTEIFAFGNSVYDIPFCKVAEGRRKFETLIKSYQNKAITDSLKTGLKENILEFLKSPDKNFPDPQLQSQANDAKLPQGIIPDLSSVFVKCSNMNYGTRTHTVILIDSENHVDFHEWTLKEPIDIENPTWIESKYEFSLTA